MVRPVRCDADALQLCDQLAPSPRSDCAAALGGTVLDLGTCTVCADRHRRLVRCVEQHNAQALKRKAAP